MRRYVLILSMIALIAAVIAPLAEGQAPPPAVEKPALMLASIYSPETNPEGWLVSEKLDGVRGFWTGTRMVSRSGHEIRVPVWFTVGFPPFPLDGELWLGRGRFSEMSGIARKDRAGDAWKQVRYAVFDAPSGSLGFEDRLDAARRWFSGHPSGHVMIVDQIPCEGREHLNRMLKGVEAKGGEGLMLRRPGSLHIPGRSPDLLKVKSFLDAEAKVVGYVGGEGKYKGKMGALVVELPGGLRFSIGTGFTDKDRENPPPMGSTVTFKYKEMNPSGIPRFASFLRVREDR